MNRFASLCIALCAVMLLAACAAKPELIARSGGNPEQVDLSGNWRLQGGAERAPTVEPQMRVPTGTSASQRSRRSGSSNGTSLGVFIEHGNLLKVSQTDYGIFFSFDRAIVHEYNFGENTDVAVGPIEARRVSGWDGQSFVTDTMDEAGNLLTESWRLEDGGEILVRDISISRKNKQSFFLRQRFEQR